MSAQRCLRTWPMALAVCLLLTAAPHAQAPAPPPPPSVKAGQAALDFTASYLTAPDANGQRQQVRLSDLRGQKHVVLTLPGVRQGPGLPTPMVAYETELSGAVMRSSTSPTLPFLSL
jgi:hypothetical protein